MQIAGVFLRFIAAYILSATPIIFIESLIHKNFGIVSKSLILLISTWFACEFYTRINKVYFTKKEATLVVTGLALINIAFYALAGYKFYTMVGGDIQLRYLRRSDIIVYTLRLLVLEPAILYVIVRVYGKLFNNSIFLDDFNKQTNVYSTSVPDDAENILDMIESLGISCNLRIETLPSGNHFVASPFTDVTASLWVDDTSRLDEIKALINDYEQSIHQAKNTWTCPSCGKSNKGKFESCRNCGLTVGEKSPPAHRKGPKKRK